MKKCPYCAAKLQNDARVCNSCGKEIPETETSQRKTNRKSIFILVGILLGVLALAGGGYILFRGMSPQMQSYTFTFDDSPAGEPADWQILYAPYSSESLIPEISKVNVQNDHLLLENTGTYSGLYVLYTNSEVMTDVQITLDTVHDEGGAIGVMLVCRYSEAGWYQMRVSNGSSAIQLVQRQGDTYNVTHLVEGKGVFLDDGTHRLSAICQGDQLTLLADGVEILSKDADFLPGGLFGFGVESYDQPNNRMAFDNIEVVELSSAATKAEPASTEVAVVEQPTATGNPSLTPTLIPAGNTPTISPTTTNTPTASLPPTSTLTPTTAPTLRPTRIPEDELVLYQTGFKSNDASLSQWHSFAYSMNAHNLSTEGYTISAKGNFYRFITTETNQRVFSIYDVDLGTDDVDISATAPRGTDKSVGLVCRYSEDGWYQFVVEPGGYWSIYLAKYDETGQLKFYKLSTANYNFGWYAGGSASGQNLDLRAECKDDRLTFYLNGILRASLIDDTFTGGKAGVLGWSFDQPDQAGLIYHFSIQRAEWSESTITGPAPTPGADGVIYSTDFNDLQALKQYWFSPPYIDTGDQGPNVVRYINDFDPGTGDVEITATVRKNPLHFALICRYSVDGWYDVGYWNDVVMGPFIGLFRVERGADGTIQGVALPGGGKQFEKAPAELSLKCSGDTLSVVIDGETAFSVQDSTWKSGRFGVYVEGNKMNQITTKTLNTVFTSYTVRAIPQAETQPTQLLEVGDVLETSLYDTTETIRQFLWINPEDERFKDVDGKLVIDTVGGGTHLSTNNLMGKNLEVSTEFEITGGTGFWGISCRSGISQAQAGIDSKGNWGIFWNNTMLTSGSFELAPGKNQFAFRCLDDQLTLLVNDEEVGALTYAYDPATANGPIELITDNTQVILSSIRFYSLAGTPEEQSTGQLVSSPPANQVVLPDYAPGEDIVQLSLDDFSKWYQIVDGKVLIPTENGIASWIYEEELNDTPIEMTADVAFTGKSGVIGLQCRYSQIGRYEFLIQPDGSWFIRRNSSEWYAPSAKYMPVLAHGTSTAIQPEANTLTIVCQGDELIFSANGEELGRAEDNLYPAGQVGYFFEKGTKGTISSLSIRHQE